MKDPGFSQECGDYFKQKSGRISSGLSAITKIEGSTNSAMVIKRKNILNFPVFILFYLIILCYYRVYIPFCQLVICQSLPQLLLVCLQGILLSNLNIALFRNKTVHAANWH